MRAWTVTALYTLVFAGLAVASARVAARNAAEFRRARREPPLVDAEIIAAPRPMSRMPKGWPAPDTVDDVRIASAYRDYARHKSEMYALLGETMLLVASAALGVTVTGFVAGGWAAWPPAFAFFTGAMGIGVRRVADSRWPAVASAFDSRRRTLLRAGLRPATWRAHFGQWSVTVDRVEPRQDAD